MFSAAAAAESPRSGRRSALDAAEPVLSDQQLAGQAQTLFRGETLRGLLLNAYAFDTMAKVALIAAWVSVAAGLLLLVLAGLGFWHGQRARAAAAGAAAE